MKKSLKIVVLTICLMLTACCFTACAPTKYDSVVEKLLDKGYTEIYVQTVDSKEIEEDLEYEFKGGAITVYAEKSTLVGDVYVSCYLFEKTADAKKVYDEAFRYYTSSEGYKCVRQGKLIVVGSEETLKDFCK